ncbi:CotH kinase family protein [Runella sp. MFBS21]|uniref:CotH kinase family protein n=1 Tax=Runella sp. MFBS21 TaxID=3034018 RepID=UPI0023F97092|nr:CotH kinase family protein [Runella sp. MFBS21]MDF7818808.1 CotH kinase family protein [Runella sp. MFBS21]
MKWIRYAGLTVTLMWITMACKDKTLDSVSSESNPDWTTESHSNGVDPNYAVVFPQDKVNSLEITLTAADWTAIKADMQTKSGSAFGAGGGMNNGGNQGGGPPGGNPPSGGIPGGNGNNGGNNGALDLINGDPIYVAATMKFNGKVWNKVGFRLKGNSSLSSTWRAGIYKLPFRLKMDEYEDQYPEIDNQRFYGFQELSMSPAYSDNSLIREKVVADIFRMGGVAAAQTAFYKIYIDFGEGLKYCGVYTMVEVIDDTMVKSQFGEDKGNIYKPESTFQTFVQSQFEKKNNKTTPDYSDVQAFVTALNSTDRTTNPTQWRTNLEKTFNVDNYLKYLAINNTIVNWDSYGAMAHNYYLYNSPTNKLTWIPWDHNMSMTSTSTNGGNMAGGGGGRSAVSLAMTEVGTGWPLIRNVAADAVYYAKYKQYVRTFTDNVFTPTKMNELFDKYTTLITPYINGAEKEVAPYTNLTNTADFTAALGILKQHVVTRNQDVNNFLK